MDKFLSHHVDRVSRNRPIRRSPRATDGLGAAGPHLLAHRPRAEAVRGLWSMSLIEVPRSGLDHALERLEAILTRAIASRGDQAVDGAHVPIHPVSVVQVTESELKLGRHAVDHDIGDALDQSRDDPRLLWLRSTFALSPLDLDIVLVALAPELESRFERIYSSLQGDFTQLAPTVDLVLRLFAAGGPTNRVSPPLCTGSAADSQPNHRTCRGPQSCLHANRESVPGRRFPDRSDAHWRSGD